MYSYYVPKYVINTEMNINCIPSYNDLQPGILSIFLTYVGDICLQFACLSSANNQGNMKVHSSSLTFPLIFRHRALFLSMYTLTEFILKNKLNFSILKKNHIRT